MALATIVATFPIAPVSADFSDKKPISFTVDGATASGYFKVVTEAMNGIVRDLSGNRGHL